MTVITNAARAHQVFRVLVADNLESEVNNVAQDLRVLGDDLDIRTVTDQADALLQPTTNYFHVAIVDLRWEKDFAIGGEVLRRFRDYRSAGLRCMMTKYVEKREELISLLRDPGRVADLLYDKSDHASGLALREVVQVSLDAWRRNYVNVEGLEAVIDAVAAKKARLGLKDVKQDAIEAEMADLVRDVFGESLPKLGVTDVSVSLRLMPAGLSSALLIEATPMLGKDASGKAIAGNRCILKLNTLDATAREAGAYARSVRFSVALDHRVELLAYSVRARLGIICYSFAGGSMAGVRQLDEVVADVDGKDFGPIEKIIRSLFSLDSKKWYSILGPEASLQGYFHDELSFGFVDAVSKWQTWARKLARRDGIHMEEDRIIIGDCALLLPRPGVVGSEIFRRKWQSCLVHGDLHGGNVMVSADGRVSLIDFANAGLGPRFLDAATLHGSIRLWDMGGVWGQPRSVEPKASRAEADRLGSQLQRTIQLEEKLLQRAPTMPSSEAAPWFKAARILDEVVEDNFRATKPTERLATYTAQAVRLSVHANVSEIGRLRCLAWYTALERSLAAAGELDD